MKTGYFRGVFGALAGLWLCGVHTPALANDFCVPSEVTDPQALHINGSKPFIYKTVGDADLRLHVFSSAGRKAGAKVPAVVFLYGGGWVVGDVRRFQTQATHLALRGLVTVLVDYRVQCRHKSTILDSVADAKSAMRWVREHADELGVDSAKIAVVGSSAGGQLAAATALIPKFDDPADNKQIDARPNALILYNPALDISSRAAVDSIATFVGKDIAEQGRAASPADYLSKDLPPTIIFQGTNDVLTPIATADTFCARARALKRPCELVRYPGAPHGFTEAWLGLDDFALGIKYEEWQLDTMRRTDLFLTRLGWLPKSPAR